jgi:hypothetical protein
MATPTPTPTLTHTHTRTHHSLSLLHRTCSLLLLAVGPPSAIIALLTLSILSLKGTERSILIRGGGEGVERRRRRGDASEGEGNHEISPPLFTYSPSLTFPPLFTHPSPLSPSLTC